ncbi:MAG: DUF3516 domain-containing protein [Polyangiales bacterium]
MSQNEPPLARRLPLDGEVLGSDEMFTRFVDYTSERGLALYPAQEDALLEIAAGHNVILNTPTGSGKSLVATALIFRAMCEGRRAIYTCPIKALVNEKFFALCDDFGPERVGMLTGDAAINRDAPILCCTAEILASMCLREGHLAPVDYVVMDEFHYYSDRERGAAWQIPLLVLSSATFLLMSATLGDTEFFERALKSLTGRPCATVRSTVRPVPLDFVYAETALQETVSKLIQNGRYPIYLVNFTQRACAEEAQNLMSVDWSTKEEKRAIAEALRGERFDSPYGKEVQRFVKHGLGLHHAGLLPRYRLLVEKLAQQGMLKVILGTDTLGVGVNIPIRTVLFTKLCKWDGEKTAILTVRDFHQIAGRAGRKGFDTQGWVVAQAPEHVIENLKLEAKAGGDPAKLRRIVRRKPPERGYVHYDRATFERLIASQPEPLRSRFQVTHGLVLNVLQRPSRRPHDNCRGLRRLLRASHGTDVDRRRRGVEALQLFRSLVEAGVLRKTRRDDGDRWEVDARLQIDFNIHNTLAMWLLDTLPKVDREGETYALDVVTLAEAICENPDVVLMRQLDRIKTEAIAEMKAQGMEYDERMAELEKLEYPKPHKDFIYATFNDFVRVHPWVGEENIRPKSIVREMFESYHSFADYVREYDLQRSEGVLLRYLSDAYKTLVQTVPAAARDEQLVEVIAYLRTMLREVDSSLLDEWERKHVLDDDQVPVPVDLRDEAAAAEAAKPDITRNRRAFIAAIRRQLYSFLKSLSSRDYLTAARYLEADPELGGASAEDLKAAMEPFHEEHAVIRVDHASRAPANTHLVEEGAESWRVRQVIVDGDDDNDWFVEVRVDLPRSREAERVVMHLEAVST